MSNTPEDTDLKLALKKDFNQLLVQEFTTDWKVRRLIIGLEIDVMSLDNLMNLITLHTQKAGETVHTDFYNAERLAKIDELLRAQENIGYVQLTPEDKKSGITRAGKYLIKRLEYLTNPTESDKQ